ncbi:MAG TPA: hypothetical protein VD997_03285 [Phycisphaerales bacterium]|nr:hypothetical protein [Phycisphaerales bacterium]
MAASKKPAPTDDTMSTDPNILPKQSPQDDILDVLAEFETGLESLKALYAQRQRLQTRIRQHEEEVQTKETALNQRAAELAQAQAAHQQRQKDLEAALAKLQSREAELDSTAKAIAADRAALDSSRHKLDEEVQARGQTLAAQAQKLADESRAVENLTHELEQQAKALEQQRAAFEQERRTRAADLAEIESLRKDLAAQREILASHEKQSKDLQARVDSLGQELKQARDLAARHAKAAEQATTSAAAASKSQVEQLAQKAAALEQQSKSLEHQNKELAKTADAARALAATAQAQAAASQVQLEQLHQKSAQLEQQNQEFAKVAGSSKSASAALQSQLTALQTKAGEFEKALAQEKSESARLSASLAQQTESAAALEKTVEGLQAKLKHELAEREEMRRQLEAAQAGLMQATARSNQLEAQLAKALNEVKALQAAAAAKPKSAVSSSNASMLRRRARLKLAHDLIRERYQKLGKANEALKKRIEQCDQIMAQRQELAAIRDRVVLAERAALRKQGGSRAAVMTLCAVGVFAVLSGLAWAVAREVAPATFLATSQLKADGRGRALNQNEIAEWQTFHQGLLGDPRFHETAAERFKKQGMATLASAPAVAEMIRENLTTETSKAGQLSLHLKGKGSDRTARELETFTAAFVSHANAAQQQRIDGSVTEVLAAATVGADPLDNTRTIYAGGILAAGVVLAGALWMLLWKRLVGAKTAFETDGEIAAALDDAKWANFAANGAAAQVAQAKHR